jgi:hypothetical protein
MGEGFAQTSSQERRSDRGEPESWIAGAVAIACVVCLVFVVYRLMVI